jgi:hypothetical protein
LEEAERPSLTHDTKDISGTPDIVATILAKIDSCAVFVADVTPVGILESGKALANPNVLIELGYAKKSVGLSRIILVWNTAFEGATPDHLPFDLRGRRAPVAYRLPPEAKKGALTSVRYTLAKELEARIRGCLTALPDMPSDEVQWHPSARVELGIWFEPGATLTITNPEYGSTLVRLRSSEGRGYARLIPERWAPVPNAGMRLQSITGLPALVGNARGLNCGTSRGGMAVYRPANTTEQPMEVGAITQWFSSTGEIWGVANEFFFEDREGKRSLSSRYIIRHWSYFISRNAYLATSVGGNLPLHIRLGVTQLEGSWWPTTGNFPHEERFAAVEEEYEYSGVLKSTEESDVWQLVTDAFNGLAAVYGRPSLSTADIATIAKEPA